MSNDISGPRIDHQKYRSNSVTGVENSWLKQYVFFNKLLKSGPILALITESKCDTPTTRYGQKEMLWHHHKIQLVPINATYSTCTNWNKNMYLQNWIKISTLCIQQNLKQDYIPFMPNIKNGDTSEHTKRNATYSLAKYKAINNLTKENIYNSSPSSYLLWVHMISKNRK